MIPCLDPIGADSAPFAFMALGMVLLAWSRWRHLFSSVFLAASLAILATWLKPWDVISLAGFLVPPYLAARHLWGRKDRAGLPMASVVIAVQVAAFVVLRRYEILGGLPFMDHPVAVVGLSYMLFRVLHLVIEAPYLGHLPFGLASYLSYVLAFWTLLSGPIQRYDAFVVGMAAVGRPAAAEALAAAHRAVNGLIKAFLLAPVFLKASDIALLKAPEATWLDAATVFYAYPVYLYLSFSGYTDLMISIGRLCGAATLPENFDRPYLARNIKDFWGRWHMSFGAWIKAYIFNPLSKRLVAASPPGKDGPALAAAVIATFVVVGVWHGTTINFVVFGLLHGMAIIGTELYGRLLKARLGRAGRKAFEAHPATRALATVLCFHFVCATILLFPNSLGDLGEVLEIFLKGRGWL
ncbi:MAG: hypothetical protein H7841_00480 [Magnetospirillum sp. WYHS-4]